MEFCGVVTEFLLCSQWHCIRMHCLFAMNPCSDATRLILWKTIPKQARFLHGLLQHLKIPSRRFVGTTLVKIACERELRYKQSNSPRSIGPKYRRANVLNHVWPDTRREVFNSNVFRVLETQKRVMVLPESWNTRLWENTTLLPIAVRIETSLQRSVKRGQDLPTGELCWGIQRQE